MPDLGQQMVTVDPLLSRDSFPRPVTHVTHCHACRLADRLIIAKDESLVPDNGPPAEPPN